MSLLVAVKSCWRDRTLGFHDAIRETWGRDLKQAGVHVMFFLGHRDSGYFLRHPEGEAVALLRDEFVVDCADDYNALPHKTRGIAKWSLPKICDHVFLCDNDTIVNAKALLTLPYQLFDYAGHFKGGQDELGRTFAYKDHTGEYPNCYPWASGGFGYFISKPAAELLVETFPKLWAEDMYVGNVLGPEIQRGNMLGGALRMINIATWHFKKSPKHPQFTPDLLRRIHKDGSPDKVYLD